ncbi:hypothetical protein NQ315_008801, partial [Exocentrus adspersus]
MNEGNVILSVFVDLKRAFETLDRNILIKKLERYGVKSSALRKIKYLGVVLDPSLTFCHHVDYLCKKIGKKVGFFYRISGVLSRNTKLLIYTTIILPHFTYCSSLLIACNKEDICRLQILQNKCMRIILKCNRFTHVDHMLKELKWLTVEQCIHQANLVLIYNIIKETLPAYFKNNLTRRADMHSYDVRSKENYNIEF